MPKINVFVKILLLFITINDRISDCSSAVSDKRLCYDKECLEPVSRATVVNTYHSREKDILSLEISQKVLVYSKSAGNRTDLWGIEVNGKRGYFPHKFLREHKILHSNLTHIVSTDELYDVIDGTTVSLKDATPTTTRHDTIDPGVVEPELNTVSIKDTNDFQDPLEVTEEIESSEQDIQTTPTLEDSSSQTINENKEILVNDSHSKNVSVVANGIHVKSESINENETLGNDSDLSDKEEIESNDVPSRANGIHVKSEFRNENETLGNDSHLSDKEEIESESINENETLENDSDLSDKEEIESNDVVNSESINENETLGNDSDLSNKEEIGTEKTVDAHQEVISEIPQLIMAPNVPLETNITVESEIPSSNESNLTLIENDTSITEEISENVDDKSEMILVETLQESSDPEIQSGNLSIPLLESMINLNEIPGNRNLLNVEEELDMIQEPTIEEINEEQTTHENKSKMEDDFEEKPSYENSVDVCQEDAECTTLIETIESTPEEQDTKNDNQKSWIYVCITAFATLIFSLGYYYIENNKRDAELIAKINELEKKFYASTKECAILEEKLKTTNSKLDRIEDESFGSNEMVLSLKSDIQDLQKFNTELEEQNSLLDKELENATEAGLELERMLREVLSANNEVNPLAQSVEDLQTRLNDQQKVNQSLTNAIDIKTHEIEHISKDLALARKNNDRLNIETLKLTEILKTERNDHYGMEQNYMDQINKLEIKLKEVNTERSIIRKEIKSKEIEIQDLTEIITQYNCNSLDLEKLYDVSRTKAESSLLLEERDQLKVKLTEIEGAHNLLDEHMEIIKEELHGLRDQCKLAEKEKKEAETKLEVLSKFFQSKEIERQKEEAKWLQQQGEVMSTVERIQTLQTEIQNYKQQVEMLKREIIDQEREYKSQISSLETKSHEQWVHARQNERRLEEAKAESGQLRNRLTIIEKNINDNDQDVKLHRMNANGESSSPGLFIGAESSSSPIMFGNSSGVPPPPSSYLYGSPFPPPFLSPMLPPNSGIPPPYDIRQRPPPLGGRLSSPPPVHHPLHPPPPLPPSDRYDGAGSPSLPSFSSLPPFDLHKSLPPPMSRFSELRDFPIPPPHCSIIPPPPLRSSHALRDDWDEEILSSSRNSGGYHQSHSRELHRVRNHKGSSHSSVESLDNSHHSGKV